MLDSWTVTTRDPETGRLEVDGASECELLKMIASERNLIATASSDSIDGSAYVGAGYFHWAIQTTPLGDGVIWMKLQDSADDITFANVTTGDHEYGPLDQEGQYGLAFVQKLSTLRRYVRVQLQYAANGQEGVTFSFDSWFIGGSTPSVPSILLPADGYSLARNDNMTIQLSKDTADGNMLGELMRISISYDNGVSWNPDQDADDWEGWVAGYSSPRVFNIGDPGGAKPQCKFKVWLEAYPSVRKESGVFSIT